MFRCGYEARWFFGKAKITGEVWTSLPHLVPYWQLIAIIFPGYTKKLHITSLAFRITTITTFGVCLTSLLLLLSYYSRSDGIPKGEVLELLQVFPGQITFLSPNPQYWNTEGIRAFWLFDEVIWDYNIFYNLLYLLLTLSFVLCMLFNIYLIHGDMLDSGNLLNFDMLLVMFLCSCEKNY